MKTNANLAKIQHLKDVGSQNKGLVDQGPQLIPLVESTSPSWFRLPAFLPWSDHPSASSNCPAAKMSQTCALAASSSLCEGIPRTAAQLSPCAAQLLKLSFGVGCKQGYSNGAPRSIWGSSNGSRTHACGTIWLCLLRDSPQKRKHVK